MHDDINHLDSVLRVCMRVSELAYHFLQTKVISSNTGMIYDHLRDKVFITSPLARDRIFAGNYGL